jgi:hypothetical protein
VLLLGGLRQAQHVLSRAEDGPHAHRAASRALITAAVIETTTTAYCRHYCERGDVPLTARRRQFEQRLAAQPSELQNGHDDNPDNNNSIDVVASRRDDRRQPEYYYYYYYYYYY